jgi:hypothetical protein
MIIAMLLLLVFFALVWISSIFLVCELRLRGPWQTLLEVCSSDGGVQLDMSRRAAAGTPLLQMRAWRIATGHRIGHLVYENRLAALMDSANERNTYFNRFGISAGAVSIGSPRAGTQPLYRWIRLPYWLFVALLLGLVLILTKAAPPNGIAGGG